jgi:hypothetical protein
VRAAIRSGTVDLALATARPRPAQLRVSAQRVRPREPVDPRAAAGDAASWPETPGGRSLTSPGGLQLAGGPIGAQPAGAHPRRPRDASRCNRKSVPNGWPGQSLDDVVPAVNDTVRYTFVVPGRRLRRGSRHCGRRPARSGRCLREAQQLLGRQALPGAQHDIRRPAHRSADRGAAAHAAQLAGHRRHPPRLRAVPQIGIPAAEKAVHEQTIRAAFATVPRPAGIDRLGDRARLPSHGWTRRTPHRSCCRCTPGPVPVATGHRPPRPSLSSGP